MGEDIVWESRHVVVLQQLRMSTTAQHLSSMVHALVAGGVAKVTDGLLPLLQLLLLLHGAFSEGRGLLVGRAAYM